MGRHVAGIVVVEASGVLSGIERARELMQSLGLFFGSELEDGNAIGEGQEIARLEGDPIKITLAEERVIGALSKTSGIATAARKACLQAGGKLQVVSGGWKKMPFEIKDMIRQAALDGGVGMRISETPFVYLDKNYIRILGGVRKAVGIAAALERSIVVQVRAETGSITDEAVEAAEAGASVIMVDTGDQDQLSQAIKAVRDKGLRSKVRIAFAGNITLDNLETLTHLDLDIVDIGYAILDAPCLPMRFDVIAVN
jgi:nicotinate-nucleotide pyrophosphorylase (carboxylating)